MKVFTLIYYQKCPDMLRTRVGIDLAVTNLLICSLQQNFQLTWEHDFKSVFTQNSIT